MFLSLKQKESKGLLRRPTPEGLNKTRPSVSHARKKCSQQAKPTDRLFKGSMIYVGM